MRSLQTIRAFSRGQEYTSGSWGNIQTIRIFSSSQTTPKFLYFLRKVTLVSGAELWEMRQSPPFNKTVPSFATSARRNEYLLSGSIFCWKIVLYDHLSVLLSMNIIYSECFRFAQGIGAINYHWDAENCCAVLSSWVFTRATYNEGLFRKRSIWEWKHNLKNKSVYYGHLGTWLAVFFVVIRYQLVNV